jgi:hypothetical protein
VGNSDDFDENPNRDSQGDDNSPKKKEVQEKLGESFACVACVEIMDSEEA